MGAQATDELFDRLDAVMRSTPAEVGVALGYELFGECRKRGLLSMETFSVLGSNFLPHRLPTYRGKHFAFVDPNIDDWDFQIGTPR